MATWKWLRLIKTILLSYLQAFLHRRWQILLTTN